MRGGVLHSGMVRRDEIRAGEVAIEAPQATDAGLVFIGRIHTPGADRLVCPRQGCPTGLPAASRSSRRGLRRSTNGCSARLDLQPLARPMLVRPRRSDP
jgi:hypothetical protein